MLTRANVTGMCGACLGQHVLANPCSTAACDGGYCGLCAPLKQSDACPSCTAPLLAAPRRPTARHACGNPGCTAVALGRGADEIVQHRLVCPHRAVQLCTDVTSVAEFARHLTTCMVCADGVLSHPLRNYEDAGEAEVLQYELDAADEENDELRASNANLLAELRATQEEHQYECAFSDSLLTQAVALHAMVSHDELSAAPRRSKRSARCD